MIIKPDTIIGGRYTIESLIATGGMGQVWMANDTVLDRKVAIKILKAEFSADRNFLTRFREEARTTARLNHPNIVSVYDYGEFQDADGGDPIAYLVMELVHAESLSHALGRLTTLTVAQTLDMLSQTAQGLSAAHEEGIIHRDVKPGNILITPRGRVKISDFGIAKAVDSVPITRTGTVMGTAQYISPEQAVGKDATSASDTYSLGIVGYEALCGKRPFDGEGSVSAAMAHVTASPNPLPNSIPANVRDLIAIALRKDPAARYKDGAEFARAVSQVQAGNPAPLPEFVLDNGPVGANTGNNLDLPTSMQPTERITAAGGAGRTASMGAAGAAGAIAGAAGAAAAQFNNAPTELLGQPGGGLVTGSNVQHPDGQYVVPSSALPYQTGYQNMPGQVGQPTQSTQPNQPGLTGGVPVQGGPYPSSAPRKTPTKEEPRGLGAGQVIFIVLGVLLVIALIAYGAYMLLGKTDLPTNQPSEQPTVTLTQTLTNSPESSESEEPSSSDTPTVDITEDEEPSSSDTESSTKSKTKTSKTSKTKPTKTSHSPTEPTSSSSSSSSDSSSSTSASATEPTSTTEASATVKPRSTTTTEHPQEP